MEPACPHAVHAGMKTIQRPEDRPSPIVCAQCGSQFSSIDDTETFCATCLLHTALSGEDVDYTRRPHQFDQYELITDNNGAPVELGRGAMGVTYKALDTNLRCEVALKVIHPRYLADKSSRARFLSEARAAAQLRHRNIASVFHLGSKRDEYFYAMELVEGETIEESGSPQRTDRLPDRAGHRLANHARSDCHRHSAICSSRCQTFKRDALQRSRWCNCGEVNRLRAGQRHH